MAMGWMLMPLKRYADFSGRSRRMEYWMWQVFKLIVGTVFMILFLGIFGAAFANLAGSKDPSQLDPNQLIAAGGGILILCLIYMIFALAIIIPDFAVAVRRLHDTNRSGWWILAPVVPYLIGVVLMVATAGVAVGMQAGDQVSTGLVAAVGIIGLVSMLAALALGLTVLIFMFIDGTPGPNRFGPDPKGRDASQVFS
jgi:uncharacterized membrane protein YhaH (DUF805 family)